MRTRKTILLLVLMLLAAACSPLRKTQRHSITDSTSLDRSEIRKAITDVLHEWGTLSQTVVEFYPPTITPPAELPEPQSAIPNSIFADTPRQREAPPATAPAVRRIVRTEIAERLTTTDSTVRNDIHVRRQGEQKEKVIEKPPPSVMAVKWIAVGFIVLFLLLLILKIKILRF
mgnify:CR=1 FL=1